MVSNCPRCQIVLHAFLVSNCPTCHDGVKLSEVPNCPRCQIVLGSSASLNYSPQYYHPKHATVLSYHTHRQTHIFHCLNLYLQMNNMIIIPIGEKISDSDRSVSLNYSQQYYHPHMPQYYQPTHKDKRMFSIVWTFISKCNNHSKGIIFHWSLSERCKKSMKT